MRLLRFFTKSKGVALQYPLAPTPRIAVLDDRFAACGPVSILNEESAKTELDRRSIETVAASPARLIRLIALDWRPVYPLIALTSPNYLLGEYDRDLLWRAFEVPVYEQVVDAQGRLLASECEAHDGLHVEFDTELRWPEMTRVEGLCGCGKPGSRLLPVPQSLALRATA